MERLVGIEACMRIDDCWRQQAGNGAHGGYWVEQGGYR